ncbi:sister chromatid cohesion factor (Chl12), putative [Talaromyces stipitatus ATCC 10500]|uniref:Sister chromatid cohesion factor (Chl12), putative n=1 Tax=Talaromyces stipitatus (strain ATCC 10500 / CBS 375.48 / QM 6759 / NRRL 1006) TaxID=441959 RepID=B8MIT6_TALSN|nr:sister chromatid cohesion factor (Chl12), putative [Talaromyces stipitatus ATCC 10500]EED15598.1 sister chromatid cohesion factor (Chl12), putative [Talaromyces stipitatus ATCC 10500]
MESDFLSSEFDPALYLHSEVSDTVIHPEPELHSFSDDLEALQQRRLEIAEENRRNNIVIQRSWKLSDVFRSDDDSQPSTFVPGQNLEVFYIDPMSVTPTKSSNRPQLDRNLVIDNFLPSTPPREMTPFMSTQSTITPSPSSTESRKRKLDSLLLVEDTKRPKTLIDVSDEENGISMDSPLGGNGSKGPRTIGGFIDEDDDDEDALAEIQDGGYLTHLAQSTTTEKETVASQHNPSGQKIRGPFIEDDDDEDAMDALRGTYTKDDAKLLQMMSQPSATEKSQPHETSTVPSVDCSSLSAETHSTIINPIFERKQPVTVKTCAGREHRVFHRQAASKTSYERLVASRSKTAEGKAQRSYYGIEIHRLLDDASSELKDNATRKVEPIHIERSIETPVIEKSGKKNSNPMWTEKYRARRFAELIGDERTHRSVLRWLKSWDHIVFPGIAKSKHAKNGTEGEWAHRKILMLTGPPGLGKTTLAHVCAQQAGYEVLEINASDERSRDVVKGRIRDAVGTENVKSISAGSDSSKANKSGRPVCVVVDEVDGVVGGSGSGGEGGFIKALIDLVMMDQKTAAARSDQNSFSGRKKKNDNFRLLRPIILICNDAYHASLRPLRTSNIAEIIHVRQVPMENVIQRLKLILTKECIQFDADGVRRLCEASWGMSAKRDRTEKNRGVSEGDIRSILVSAEWVARKLQAESTTTPRLTKAWLEDNILNDSESGGGSRGLGRGGVRDITDRVFIEGAGFPTAPVSSNSFSDPFDRERTKTSVGVAELRRRHAAAKLREMIDASGEYDRCATDCFIEYPTRTYQDDTFLSKPNAAYDWLHFHDMISSKIFSNQDWELNPYMSQSTLAFHHLFAGNASSSNKRKFDDDQTEEEEHPFSGPRADYAAFEALKQNKSVLVGFQSTFSAPLLRLFRSLDSIATDLVPNLLRMLSPEVKPVIVRGSEQASVASVRKESERALVRAAVRVMSGLNVTFEKVRVGNDGVHAGWAYRMEPPIDTLVGFSKTKGTILDAGSSGPVRYAIRQVLDQEYRKETLRKQGETLLGLSGSSNKASKGKQSSKDEDKENANGSRPKLGGPDAAGVKRDFFGRIIRNNETAPASTTSNKARQPAHKRNSSGNDHDRKVWVTFHEGFSNAVRKPITIAELLSEL